MADSEQPPPSETPLLDPSQNQTESPPDQPPEDNRGGEERVKGDLDRSMRRLETFLTFFGFNRSSTLGLFLSWTAFLVIGVMLPLKMLKLSDCKGCEKYQKKNFELFIMIFCVSSNLREHGMRNFLFLDQLNDQWNA